MFFIRENKILEREFKQNLDIFVHVGKHDKQFFLCYTLIHFGIILLFFL